MTEPTLIEIFNGVASGLSIDPAILFNELSARSTSKLSSPPTESELIQCLYEYSGSDKVAEIFNEGYDESDFWAGYGDLLYSDTGDYSNVVEIVLRAFSPDWVDWTDMDCSKFELICAGLSVMKPTWFVVVCIKLAVDTANGAGNNVSNG